MFYAKSTGGFYDRAIHGDNIPADAVEIYEAVHAALLEGQAVGKIIVSDENGFPVLQDPPKTTIPEMWERIKAERERRKVGGVKVGAHWFHTDDSSKIQYIGLAMMGAGMQASLKWKKMDGTFVTMTPELAGQVLQAVAALDVTAFAKAEEHRVAMEASADPASYDFSTGWPQTYAETLVP